MGDNYIYLKIAEDIHRRILSGELNPGDRLPTVREMAGRWDCTPGTVQRAYRQLVRRGLLVTRRGRGTRVAGVSTARSETPLRRASLVHRAEAFLLETLINGYSPAEVEDAVGQALDRWRVVEQRGSAETTDTLRFTGSHDLAVTWISAHFAEIVPQCGMEVTICGSLGGMIALLEGNADLAGCHLWDRESETYNGPFVRRLLPGQRVALVTLAHRRLGLIVPPDNPAQVSSLQDLSRPELRFVNRQAGSGTRVWFDAALQELFVLPSQIRGYEKERMTHSEVARMVAEGQAEVGFGLQAAAQAYELGFVPLTEERYDLVIPETSTTHSAVQSLIEWLKTPSAAEIIGSFAGYLTAETGVLRWVE
jgi:putative molybdopterin biosynthesis protein